MHSLRHKIRMDTYVVGGVDLGDEVLSEEGNLLRGGLAGKLSRHVLMAN